MATNLTTTPASGTQSSTQNPQTAGNSVGPGAPASSVQPGTVGSLDNTTGGVPLVTTPLSTVALPAASTAVAKPAPPVHHTSPLVVGAAALLFIVALVLLLSVFLPAKITTE